MKNSRKKNFNSKQLINELEELRKKVHDLKSSDVDFNSLKSALNIIYDAIDSTVGGIVITNIRGVIVYVNPSFLRIFEYDDRREVLGKDAGDLFEKETIKGLSDVKAVIDLTDGKTHEFTVRRKDTTTFPVEVSVSNVKSSDGLAVGRMASFVDITKRKRAEEEREKVIRKLQRALDSIKTLHGLLPICAACKKIRDDKGYWHQVEVYIKEHSDVSFSHGICPDCFKKLYPGFRYPDESVV